MVSGRIVKKKVGIFHNYQMNYLIEFDLHIDILSILHMFWAKMVKKEMPKEA